MLLRRIMNTKISEERLSHSLPADAKVEEFDLKGIEKGVTYEVVDGNGKKVGEIDGDRLRFLIRAEEKIPWTDILDMVEKVRRDRNLTILLVSHNMDDAARMADRVLVLDKGHLAMNGTPREVFSHHKELHEIGLGAPSSSELLYLLKEKGLNVRTDIFDEDEAAREIVNALR